MGKGIKKLDILNFFKPQNEFIELVEDYRENFLNNY